eukprot:Awhi_evm1s10770
MNLQTQYTFANNERNPESTKIKGKIVLFIRTSSASRLEHYQRFKDMGAELWVFEEAINPLFANVFDEWIIGNIHDPCE